MPVEFTYRCDLAAGLHARPCSLIAELTARLDAASCLTNKRNGRSADLQSVLSLISADVLAGDECVVTVTGAAADAAAGRLRTFLEKELAALEAPLPGEPVTAGTLPRALRLAGVKVTFGAPLSAGFGRGVVLNIGGIQLPEPSGIKAASPAAEEQRVRDGMQQLRSDLGHTASHSTTPGAAGIVKAHLAILDDPTFGEKIAHDIQQGSTAGDAILRAARYFAEAFAASESAYIRERAIDIQEIGLRLYEASCGSVVASVPVRLARPTVLVAPNLGTQELLGLDREQLKGIVFGPGQATSHAAILVRALGIPAVSATSEEGASLVNGEDVILDGSRGYVVVPIAEVLRFYEREGVVEARRREKLRRYAEFVGVTADDRPMEVAANVSSPDEAEAAFAKGCDGVGLFRTEMLFVGRTVPPTEEEQFEAYERTVKAARNRPVILRTFDAGGDKPVSFLRYPGANGALGNRGLLIYKENPEVLAAQLRALLRASALGKVRIMVPLISTAEEVKWMHERLGVAKQELVRRKLPFDAKIELGVMIELPAAVPNLPAIAAQSDFFSIGTNDLAQYFFFEDRTQARSDLRARVRHPSFLRLLREIATAAKHAGKWLGMCGEMAGDPANLPLLVGLGLDEISLGGDMLAMKSNLLRLDSTTCADLLDKACACDSADEVESLLAAFASAAAVPVVAPELLVIESASTSREDAVRELADVLYLEGRAADADRLEEAIWAREATYPTDMGLGFALPHCKSTVVQHSSIAVLRPAAPFLWAAESAAPVRAVIMLAMKDEPGAHMQVLSKLARKLMDETFRERLLTCKAGADAVQLLTHEVGIT